MGGYIVPFVRKFVALEINSKKMDFFEREIDFFRIFVMRCRARVEI